MKPRFTVDTHIFRELGQYLVGRDSTALAELVKNTYDADATKVTVYGEALDDPARGMIRIVDNGNGMTPEEFSGGFLRIAGRLKEAGERRSPRFHRRFTGAKGIGRLAAQKLAGLMEIESVPYKAPRGETRATLVASIDWDLIEEHETLDNVEGTAALRVVERPVSQKSTSGTTITLRKLRRTWTGDVLREFAAELDTFRAPSLLTQTLPAAVLDGPLLFDKPLVADVAGHEGYELVFDGEFAQGESLYPAAAQAAQWVLEIDASTRIVKYAIAPTKRTLESARFAKRRDFETPHPSPKEGPFFQARVLLRGRAASKKEAAIYSGVRVYMEGFRVLPYGDLTDDWLRLKQSVTERTRKLELGDGVPLPEQPDEGLFLLPPKHYAGGVFLTQKRAPALHMVINREGFIAGAAFTNVQELVRRGIDLMTRVRAQVADEEKRRGERKKRGAPEDDETADPDAAYRRNIVEDSLAHLRDGATELRSLAARVPRVDADLLERLAGEMEAAERVSRAYISEHAFTRVLASVGLQLAAFVHELNALLGMTTSLERSIARVRDDSDGKARTELARIHAGVVDMRRTLERQASYLLDVATPDARRRRSRQPLAERFDAAVRLVRLSAERKGITIENEVPADLRTPAMYSSELIAVFSNLLTNAVKAAREGGHIRATGSTRADGTTRVRVENTGVAVDLGEAERWFRPFESTTTEVDPVLGQGMGLGLTITRDILDEYQVKIRFVAPSAKFATAIEIIFPAA
jgi:signal transduction histidine kinase